MRAADLQEDRGRMWDLKYVRAKCMVAVMGGVCGLDRFRRYPCKFVGQGETSQGMSCVRYRKWRERGSSGSIIKIGGTASQWLRLPTRQKQAAVEDTPKDVIFDVQVRKGTVRLIDEEE